MAARQVLLAGVYVLCYHLQLAKKHLLLASLQAMDNLVALNGRFIV